MFIKKILIYCFNKGNEIVFCFYQGIFVEFIMFFGESEYYDFII